MHKTVTVDLVESVLEANRELAMQNRALFKAHGVRAFDFLGAVGSGKTMLIERLSEILSARGVRVGAIAGDVAGDDDHRRFLARGIVSENLNTGKECHLDAPTSPWGRRRGWWSSPPPRATTPCASTPSSSGTPTWV